ncbi:TRAP transporter substrate-binding protein [Aminobacterium colombiense]|uniref:TRAP dicarboxylate transporter, DctP subunit n=1 Tax=Aminobacterium colombiense (strain DSM 12261 / ALA-1) TaxID=572547 RepID=D5ECJ6_AMICL|nr:TRAP transporter substrate-binding protein [Aminobacterium colombiense]ADE56278.1 TRAP dicarboxylate transporter, DctP subunit [Aminobacterium colombiense DSM 12261]
MKRFLRGLALFVVMGLIFGLVGTLGMGSAFASSDTYVFKLAIEMPERHPYWMGATKFNELLQEKTGGRVKIDIYPSGQLGTQKDTAEAVAMGALEFSLVSGAVLERYDPRAEVVQLPFVFRDLDHAHKTMFGDFGKKMGSWFEAKGIMVPSFLLNGPKHVTSTMEIGSPADMKGIKLRTQQAPTMIEFGKALGCVVSPMPYGEVYTALQLNTVDAEVQCVANVLFDKHYEVAKNMNDVTLFVYLEPLLMSKKVYDGLPKDIQEAILECAVEAADWQWNYYRSNMHETFIPELTKLGVKFNAGDAAEWKKALEDAGYYNKFEQHKPLMDEIAEVK